MIFQNDDDDNENENPHIDVRSNSVEHGKWSALLGTDREKDDVAAILFSSQKHLRYLLRVNGRSPSSLK